MPLLDHFRPPLAPIHRWESFQSNWATRLADALNDSLPPEYMAEEHTYAGTRLEIDVAAFEHTRGGPDSNGVALAEPAVYAPPAPAFTIAAVPAESYEIRVFNTSSGLTLVGVIELVSPGNKDRDDERRAFAIKVASYLHQGVSVIVVDIVTNRRANLHNETLHLLDALPEHAMPDEAHLYAVAYRPVSREERTEIDVWPHPLALGQRLPRLPLRLTGDTFVPVDFEAAYEEACRHRRLR